MTRRSPAIAGGTPVRSELLPYGLHAVGPAEEAAVIDVLRHGWLTTGPRTREFEAAFAAAVGAPHAVALATGTAALHLTTLALGIGKGDEVITSPLTFVATANAIVHAGAQPVFADIDPETLNIDPESVHRRITKKTRAIIPVHYAGAPCDLEALWSVASSRRIHVLEDACHAVGATYHGRPIGSKGEAQCFSFHPVKNMTTAEGGVVTTRRAVVAERLRTLRFHGFREDYLSRSKKGALGYPRMQLLGTKSILTDLQAALGLVQLGRVEEFTERRRALAARYDAAFADTPEITTPAELTDTASAWHIYVMRLDLRALRATRDEFMHALRQEGIGTSVHYLPVHRQPFYRRTFGFGPGLCPIAEREYRRMITIPLFPTMTERDQDDVVEAVKSLVAYYRR